MAWVHGDMAAYRLLVVLARIQGESLAKSQGQSHGLSECIEMVQFSLSGYVQIPILFSASATHDAPPCSLLIGALRVDGMGRDVVPLFALSLVTRTLFSFPLQLSCARAVIFTLFSVLCAVIL